MVRFAKGVGRYITGRKHGHGFRRLDNVVVFHPDESADALYDDLELNARVND